MSEQTNTRIETRECPVCGRQFNQRLGVRGRPRNTCGKRCTDLNSWLNASSAILEGMTFGSDDARKAMRRQLWRMANLLNQAPVVGAEEVA